jgi:Protein of unknown function (DUF2442)
MAHGPIDPFPYTDAELQRQFADATARATQADRRVLRAVTAAYDKRTKRVVIEFPSGVVVQIPSHLLQGLADAAPPELAAVTLSPQGTALHWEALDVDFSVAGLLAGVFGTQVWMAEMGRKGGRAKSAAKVAAAQANGQKGGRPPGYRRLQSQGMPPRATPHGENRSLRRSQS